MSDVRNTPLRITRQEDFNTDQAEEVCRKSALIPLVEEVAVTWQP